MRQSFTATIERNTTFAADFETEPYEAGWAAEARWFICILEVSGRHVGLTISAQVSPDGLFWCDEGAGLDLGWRPPSPPSPGGPPVSPGSPYLSEPPSLAPGLHSFALTNFGAWLRLRCHLHGADAKIKVLIHLALKE